MVARKINKVTDDLKVILDMLGSPVGWIWQNAMDVKELYAYRQSLIKNYQQLSAHEKQFLFAELSGHLLSGLFAGIKLVQQSIVFIDSKAVVDSFLETSPYASQMMGVAAFFAQAVLTLKEYRQYHRQRLYLNDLELLIADLSQQIEQQYKDCQPYLGAPVHADKALLDNIAKTKAQLQISNSPSTVVADLVRHKSLASLIAEQALAAYHDSTPELGLTRIYQFAIDEKIMAAPCQDASQRQRLQQYVIAKQQQQHLAVARPLLSSQNQQQKLRVLLGITAVSLAVVLAVASSGVLAPAVAITFYSVSSMLGLSLNLHKKYLKQKYQKVDDLTKQIEATANNNLAAQERLYQNPDDYVELASRLIALVKLYTDKLTQPLQMLLLSNRFAELPAFDQVFEIKQQAKLAYQQASRWQRFSIEHHELYKVIGKIDVAEHESALKSISSLQQEVQQRAVKQQRRQQPNSAQPSSAQPSSAQTGSLSARGNSLFAHARLQTEVQPSHKPVDPGLLAKLRR